MGSLMLARFFWRPNLSLAKHTPLSLSFMKVSGCCDRHFLNDQNNYTFVILAGPLYQGPVAVLLFSLHSAKRCSICPETTVAEALEILVQF